MREEKIKEISGILKGVGKAHKRFELSLKGIGAFPNERSPRIIWIGVERGREEIIKLQEGIEESLSTLGFKREERKFHPHLTIARVKGRADFKELLGVPYKSRVFLTDSLVLFKSTLTPKGPIYGELEKFPLARD